MNDDFIKGFLSSISKEQLEGLIKSSADNPEELMKMAKQFAPMGLVLLDTFMTNESDKIISVMSKEAHDLAVSFIQMDLPMFAMMFKNIPEQSIKQIVAQAKAELSPDKIAEQVKNQKAMVASMTEEQHIAFFETILDILPERSREFYMSLYDMADECEAGDVVRRMRAYIANTDEAELVADRIDALYLVKPEDVLLITNDIAAHMSANGAQKLADAFNKHVKPEDMEAVARTGIDLSREFLEAVSKGIDPEPKDLKTLGAFTDSIKDLLTGIEKAVEEADAVPPSLKAWAASAKGSLLPRPPKP